MRRLGIAAVVLALAVCSCKTPYMITGVRNLPVYSDAHVQHICKVKTIGNYNLRGKSFYVEVGKPDMDVNSVEFQEYAGHLANALAVQGAKRTTLKLAADLCVKLDYSTLNSSVGEVVGYIINVVGSDNKAFGRPEVFRSLLTTSDSGVLRDIFPYLMYCSTGTYGKESEGTYNVSEDDYIYKKWANNEFTSPTLYLLPKAKSSTAPEQYSVAGIESLNGKTQVVLAMKQEQIKDSLPGDFILEVGGKEYKVEESNIPLGRYIMVVEMVYVYLDFPCTVSAGDKVTLKAMGGDKLDKVIWSIKEMTL